MPRVANAPRAQQFSVASPQKHQQSPFKIPFNNDAQEKAVRLQSRQALQELQMNQIKAAASPVRKLNNYQRAASGSPKTPSKNAARGKENIDDGGLAVVGTSAITPPKRVPILANFEEWMKMATDNKINATNSWNFALIDYFHDMSLLKEGDGVNFQKASCTLDGCVKIYTSRVDSVATETGKLLSGLADSNSKKSKRGEEGEEDDDGADEEGDGEDGVRKKVKKKTQRSCEATLAPSFASLQLKKFELEFSVDPLFKKASSDFDEGGAKGLLLNHLSIDAEGRIVFDSSDDTEDATQEPQSDEHQQPAEAFSGNTENSVGKDIDLQALGSKFFPNLDRLDEQDICPSLKNFDLGDPSGSLDIPALKNSEDWQQSGASSEHNAPDMSGMLPDDENAPGFDDDDGGVLAGFDTGAEAAFGEGGEAWAKTAAIEPVPMQNPAYGASQTEEGVGVGDFDPDTNQYAVSLHHRREAGHEDILSYFDNALQKNWAGPEHWRIRRIKDANKAAAPAPAKRKEREPFEIDFLSPLDPMLAEMIYTPAASNASISLPKTQWKSKTRNLLPDDKHFNSRQLLRLFLKPKARMGVRRSGVKGGTSQSLKQEVEPEGEMDGAFWARKENVAVPEDDAPAQGNYDANFFQDDNLDAGPPEDDFADAREVLTPPPDSQGSDGVGIDGLLAGPQSQEGAFGTQLVTQSRRLRPEYVQYAKTATKVDVRRLKEEMWKGIGFEEPSPTASKAEQQPTPQPASNDEQEPLKFTNIVNNLTTAYPPQAMKDISTSYCFICLLHLANEKGLEISNEPGLEDLSIRKDWTAEITGEA